MATAENTKITKKVVKEVEEEVAQVVITVSADEAAIISAAVGAVRPTNALGDVNVYHLFRVLNDATRNSGAARITSEASVTLKADPFGW